MNTKIYEKTRWENIFRHKVNKNYIIRFHGSVQTSISKDERGNKIYDSDTARKIRDNQILIQKKKIEIKHKETFDDLWEKYIENCKYVKKQAYNTIAKKEKIYNKYIKSKIKISVNKLTKEYWAKFIEKCNCSDKQKNDIIKIIKAFLNWCIEENIIITNEIAKIKTYKVTNSEMKYWTIEEVKKFFYQIDILINNSPDIIFKKQALMIKTLVMICFSLGDRIGETRALRFSSINEEKKSIIISHSINYDKSNNNFLSNTKNYHSQREILITDKLINQIHIYRNFLIKAMHYKVEKDSLIFYNYSTNAPYSDTFLRKQFHRFCDLCKVTKIRLYDLRHTYVATMMYEGRELYQISSRIGHSNYSTTVNKYGHLSTELKKEIANSTDKYI